MVDAALPYRNRDSRRLDAGFARSDGEGFFGNLALLGIEIGRSYSASVAGVIGSTWSRRTVPFQVLASVAAAATAGVAR
jgi:hypothetical protein